jgi:hypothetical protein
MLLQACLGLSIDAPASRVCFTYPVLPRSLSEVRIKQLRVGDASVDILLLRHDDDVGINILRRTGNVEIRMIK